MLNYEADRSKESGYIFTRWDKNLNFGMHLHTSFEFIYVSSGELSVHIENREYTLTAGNAMLILPNQAHSYTTADSAENFLCIFSVSYAYGFYSKTKDKTPLSPIFKLTDTSVLDDMQAPPEDNEYLLKSAFYKVIHNFNANTTYAPKQAKKQNILANIILFAENNYNKDVTLEDLAKEFAYSYNYLSCVINEMLNMNFATLLNTQRINRAAYMIQNTDYSFTEIALQCGYSSIRSFNRNFKRFTGKTPGEYRITLKIQ